MKKFDSVRILLSISLLAIGSLACGDASAMAKRQPQDNPPIVPVLNAPDPDRYDQGYQLGNRNGNLIAVRLKSRTIGIEGCSALPAYQDALLKVSRTIQAPATSGQPQERALVRGFFRGYLDAVRSAIQESRNGCNLSAFDNGGYAGDLYGSLLCQISKVDLGIVTELEITPLYDGWSNGSSEVLNQCVSSASLVIEQCGNDLQSLGASLELIVNLSCSDTSI